MPIEFSFSEVLDEIDAIRDLAEPLLEPDDIWKLDTFKTALVTIRARRTWARWEISQRDPLRTLACGGGYERGRTGRTGVFGELSALWEIQPMPEKKPSHLPTKFALAGIATSKLKLVEKTLGGRKEYVTWRMEVGDSQSPGAYFHIQLGESVDDAQSNPLPIPRIPCPPTTPLLALECMLAELFQDDWPERLGAQTRQAGRWRRLQEARYQAFTGWQSDVLKQRSGSVVVDLKVAQPAATIFTSVLGT